MKTDTQPRAFRSILVTGGCGFIGSNFIRHLLTESDFSGQIVNLDKLTYAGNPESLADIRERFPERYRFVRADICDRGAVRDVFRRNGISAVCHFAAESHVDRSIVAPDAFIKTNVEGTFTLLEVAREQGERLELFHHVSTDEVYGSLGRDGVFTEETAYRPNSPYSASKAASDHLVRAYGETYGLPVTISNCSNNYMLLLDDAEGNVWVMKGFQLGVTPKYTYEQFVAAGQSQFKQLPPGWKFRVKKLEKDLVEIPEGGVATIMPDEFFNVYDKTGPGMTNYKP